MENINIIHSLFFAWVFGIGFSVSFSVLRRIITDVIQK